MVGETTWPDSMYVRARGENGDMEILNPMAPQAGKPVNASTPDGVVVDETVDGPSTYERRAPSVRRDGVRTGRRR